MSLLLTSLVPVPVLALAAALEAPAPVPVAAAAAASSVLFASVLVSAPEVRLVAADTSAIEAVVPVAVPERTHYIDCTKSRFCSLKVGPVLGFSVHIVAFP